MKKLKTPRLVTVIVFTTITAIFWVFYGTYAVLTSSPSLDVPPEILNPISPQLDTETLKQLESRIYFEKGETMFAPVITEEAISTPTPTETRTTPTPTESVEISPATESAEI